MHHKRLRSSRRQGRGRTGPSRSRNGRCVGYGRHPLEHLLHIAGVLLVGHFGGGRRRRRQWRRRRSSSSRRRLRGRRITTGRIRAARVRRHFRCHVSAHQPQPVKVGRAIRPRRCRARVERRTAAQLPLKTRLPVNITRYCWMRLKRT